MAEIKKKNIRPSENAAAVGREVVDTVAKGGKVSLRKIIKRHGYSDAVAGNPKRVTKTTSYKAEVQPLLARLVSLRDKIIAQMEKRMPAAQYSALSGSVETISKQINLLSGKPTDNVQYILPEETKKKLKDILKDNS